MAQQQKSKTAARRSTGKPVFARIVLQNGSQYEVIENFATVLRHQREALSTREARRGWKFWRKPVSVEPVITMTGPTGTRVAMDPREIISVVEIVKPTRNYSRNGKPDETNAQQPTRRGRKRARQPAKVV